MHMRPGFRLDAWTTLLRLCRRRESKMSARLNLASGSSLEDKRSFGRGQHVVSNSL